MVRVRVTDLQRQGASIVITRLTVRGDTVFSRQIPYRGVPMSRRHVDSVEQAFAKKVAVYFAKESR